MAVVIVGNLWLRVKGDIYPLTSLHAVQTYNINLTFLSY